MKNFIKLIIQSIVGTMLILGFFDVLGLIEGFMELHPWTIIIPIIIIIIDFMRE